MTPPASGRRWAVSRGGPDLPLDPDIDADEDLHHHGVAVAVRRGGRAGGRLPRIRPGIVLAVAVGGFFGSLLRYEVGLAWPAGAGAFPWGLFGVNTAGAFILALLLVLTLEVLPPGTYLRPLVGTGFCGALTTFSSVATAFDQLLAHGHAGVAVGFLASSLAAGLAAGSFGLVLGRSIAVGRRYRSA